MKSYKKVLVFFMAKTLKDIANHTLKLAKMFSQWPIPFKANSIPYSNASVSKYGVISGPYFPVFGLYSGAIKACKKFASSNRIILQTKQLVKLII